MTGLTSGVRGVSILVFVELALDVYLWGQEDEKTEVSILVFVELALDGRRRHGRCQSLYRLFQSLFSWNLLLMPRRRTLSRRLLVVSILVFVELALDARPLEGGCGRRRQVSILVFVELALDEKRKQQP